MRIVNPSFGISATSAEKVALKPVNWATDAIALVSNSKPNAREIQACKPWLVAEMQVIKPPVVVALGATAAQALMGPSFRVTKERGIPRETQWAPFTLATYHPSALLRMPDETSRERAYDEFLTDLRKVAKHLATFS